MVMHAAWKMDTVGKKEARQEIAMIKVMAANMVMSVLDRAIQVYGAAGVSDDTPIARFWREQRIDADRRWSRRGPSHDHRRGANFANGSEGFGFDQLAALFGGIRDLQCQKYPSQFLN